MTTAASEHSAKQKVSVQHFWSGEGNLSYLIINPGSREAILIDPDLEILGEYLLALDRRELTLRAVLDTHGHADHASAAPALVKLTGVDYFANRHSPSSFVTQRVQDNDERVLGGIPVTFLHCPGHTQDLNVIQIEHYLFTGDCLFNKSCGRTDLPTGDAAKQFDSLQRLMAFPDHFIVFPGHDYNNQVSSTVAEIKQNNRRVQFTDKDEFVRFMADFYANEERPDDIEYYIAFNSR